MSNSLLDSSAFGRVAALEESQSVAPILPEPRLLGGPDGVSVVIPAWNEEHRLPDTLDKYVRLLEAYGAEFEVIVVADGVTDRTVEVASGYAERRVRVLQFEHKLGKGGAILEGLREARFDFVGFLDADAPITPVNLAYLLSQLAFSDGAIASRWIGKSVGSPRQSFARVLFSRLWNSLTRVLLGLNLYDTQCGAKFFRREALTQVLNKVTLTNWAFDASLLFHFQRAGYTVREVPVNWTDDPNSKLDLGRAIPAMFLSLIGIRLMSLPHLAKLAQAWAIRLHRFIN
jgi:dolichol-phosphate mannosyltransferase